MSGKVVPWILLCIVLTRQVAAQADEVKTVDEIIAKYIEAIGGRERLASVKSMRMTGRAIGAGGMEIAGTAEFKRPGRMRVEYTVQGMTVIRAYDGETGWFIMPLRGKTDPEKAPRDRTESMKDQADFEGPLVDYSKKGHQVELIGEGDVEGAKAYKLKVTKKNGNIEYHYLDAEYFLPLKVEGKRKFQGSEVGYETSYGDYKEIDGLLFAHAWQEKVDSGSGGSVTTENVIVEKVELNVNLSDARFAMPKVKKEEPAERDND